MKIKTYKDKIEFLKKIRIVMLSVILVGVLTLGIHTFLDDSFGVLDFEVHLGIVVIPGLVVTVIWYLYSRKIEREMRELK